MQTKLIQTRKIKAAVALTAITSFLLMPVNLACANNITAGNSGVGSLTNIQHNGNTTDITSGFVQNGTGMNHFNNFEVSAGGVANLLGANRYINMVNKGVNIEGVLNAFTKGNLPANTMFVSPEGFAVGAGGVLNVGGLQVITPSVSDYNTLLQKAGTNASNITLSVDDFTTLKAAGDGIIEIDGQINSLEDVILKAGSGIFFSESGIIDTVSGIDNVKGIGDVALFTNTGDIVGSNAINIDASGNITLVASNGGIGTSLNPNPANYGEQKSVTPLNVKLADGKLLNVEVSSQKADVNDGFFTGIGSVANHSKNLTVGALKGDNIKIANNGDGVLSTNQDIAKVNKLYLNAENGKLKVNEKIETTNIIRLNGKNGVDVDKNLKVNGNGYISVYSENGKIAMQDASLNTGNIDINAKDDVTIGNLEIVNRGKYEDNLRLVENKRLSTGIVAPDTFRDDGIHVTSVNSNIKQNKGSQIKSAGVIDFTAGKSVDANVKAVDKVTAHANENVKLTAEGTTRLGDVNANNIDITGETFLVDGRVIGNNTVNIKASDKLTVRPKTYLDANHRTYGFIAADNDVTINADNGILATEQRPEGAMITSTNGNVNLITKGDIKALAENQNITVDAKVKTNATGNNINLHLLNENGGIGTIAAAVDANVSAVKDVTVNGKISAGNDLTVLAGENIKQAVGGVAFISGNDMNLTSTGANVGLPTGYLQVEVGNELNATANKGGVYIGSPKDLVIGQIIAGSDLALLGANNIKQGSKDVAIIAGGNANISANNGDIGASDKYLQVKVGKELSAKASNNVYIGSKEDLTLGEVEAKNVNLIGEKNIKQGSKDIAIISTSNTNIKSVNNSIGAADKKLAVKVGGALTAEAKEDVNIISKDELIIDKIVAGNDVKLESDKGIQRKYYGSNVPTTIKAGNDIDIIAKDGGIGAQSMAIKVDLDGILNAEASYDIYINGVNDLNASLIKAGRTAYLETPGALTVLEAITGEDLALVAGDDVIATNVSVDRWFGAHGQNVYVDSVKDLYVASLSADNDAVIVSAGSIIDPLLYVVGQEWNTVDKNLVTVGNNLVLVSEGDIGRTYSPLRVRVGGTLNSEAKGNTYIGAKGDLTVAKAQSGQDLSIKVENNLKQKENDVVSFISGKNMNLESLAENVGESSKYLQVQVGNELNAKAKENVYIGSKEDVTIGTIEAKNVNLIGEKNINQGSKEVAIKATEDATIESKNESIGTKENHLVVSVGKELTAKAKKDVNIASKGDLVINKIEAGEDLSVKAEGNLKQKIANVVSFISGRNMNLESATANVGEADKYLQVQVGNKLSAKAKENVYIGSKEDLTIGKIEAGNDVAIVGEKNILGDSMTSTSITAGNDLTIKSIGGNIGTTEADLGDEGGLLLMSPEVLSINIGGILTAEAQDNISIYSINDINADLINAGVSAQLVTTGGFTAVDVTTGNHLTISARNDVVAPNITVGGIFNANGDNIYVNTGSDLKIGHVSAVKDAVIEATGNIEFPAGSPIIINGIQPYTAISTGKNLTLTSTNASIGTNNAVAVAVGGVLTANAAEDIKIFGSGDLTVAEANAGNNLAIATSRNLKQQTEGKVSFTSGGDMFLGSSEANVGESSKYLQVKAGKELSAYAKENVYIGSKEDVTLGTVQAGKDVSLIGQKNIKKGSQDVAIVANGNLDIESVNASIGEAGNELTMDIDGIVNVKAADDVYIYAKSVIPPAITQTAHITIGKAEAGNNLYIKSEGQIAQAVADELSFISGGDMTFDAFLDMLYASVGTSDKYLHVQVGGELNADALGGVFIASKDDLTVGQIKGNIVNLIGGENIYQGSKDVAIISNGYTNIKAENGSIGTTDKKLVVDIGAAYMEGLHYDTSLSAEAKNDVNISAKGKLTVNTIKAGNDVNLDGDNSILAYKTEPAILAGNNLTINANGGDIGAADNYMTIDIGGILDATAKDDIYIATNGDLVVKNADAGHDLLIKADGNIDQVNVGDLTFKSGNDMTLESTSANVGNSSKYLQVQVGNELNAKAKENVYIGSKEDVTIGTIEAKNVNLIGEKNIKQGSKEVAIKATEDVNIESVKESIGTKENHLVVSVGKELTAKAKKDVNIASKGDLVINKIEAGEDLSVKAEGNLKQKIANVVSFISGRNMNLESATANVGEADKYLQVQVGNELSAKAKENVYIGSKEDVTIGTIEAKNVNLVGEKNIKQGSKEVAIKATEDATIESKNESIGTKENKLVVSIGKVLNAKAKKDVNIASKGDLALNSVIAGNDVSIESDASILAARGNYNNPIIQAGNNLALNAVGGDIGSGLTNMTIDIGGILTADAKDNIYIYSKNDIHADSVNAGNNVLVDTNGRLDIDNATIGNDLKAFADGDIDIDNLNLGGHVTAWGENVYIDSIADVAINSIYANDAVINSTGSVKATENPTVSGRPTIISNNLTINANGGDIGAADNYMRIDITGVLDATAKDDIYISTDGDLVVKNADAGHDLVIKADGNIDQVNVGDLTFKSGNDMTLESATANVGNPDKYLQVSVGGELNAYAKENVYIGSKEDLTLGTVEAKNVNLVGDKNIKQGSKEVAIKASEDLNIKANGTDIGAADKYLNVDIEGVINANATGDIYINGLGNVNIEQVIAGGNIGLKAEDNLTQTTVFDINNPTIIAGGNMTLDSINGNVGDPDNSLSIVVPGQLNADAPNGGVYIGSKESITIDLINGGKDVNILSDSFIHQTENGPVPAIIAGENLVLKSNTDNVGDPNNYLQVSVGGELTATAENGGVYIGSPVDITINKVIAGTNVVIDGQKNVLQGTTEPAITAGNNLTINANGGDIGASDNYMTIDIGGILDVTAQDNIYIAVNGDVVVKNADAGNDLVIKADGNIDQVNIGDLTFKSGNDMTLESKDANVGNPDKYLQVSVGGELIGKAENGGVYIGSPNNIVINQIIAATDVVVDADGYIHQTDNGPRPAIIAGEDLTIKSNHDNVGDPNNYLTINIGGELKADAPEGGVYIKADGDLNVKHVIANTDVVLNVENNLHQVDEFDINNPTIIAGGDMTLNSEHGDVGDPNNHLSVTIGGELNAEAPEGGVYIGSKDNITIGQIKAGDDVDLESDGYIHQTDNGPRPAIIAGDDLTIKSNHDNVGDPDNYLTIDIGGELDAEAPEGGVYIGSPSDIVIDKVIAADDVVIKSDESVILPHDGDENNPDIKAGGDVKIEAGDSVINGGGDGVGIVTDGDVDIKANTNDKEPAGTIGKKPYDDPTTSINIIIGDNSEVRLEEVGTPIEDQVLNVNILNRGIVDGGNGNGNINGNGGSYDVDDRDQRTLNVLNDKEDQDSTYTHHRQDLRYNVTAEDYQLVSSESDSGVKVEDVLNISKGGMLVRTDELANVGENVQITMDYKGMPFTIEGQVVRTDAAKNTAGVQFNSVDQYTASMLLYLGMMNQGI